MYHRSNRFTEALTPIVLIAFLAGTMCVLMHFQQTERQAKAYCLARHMHVREESRFYGKSLSREFQCVDSEGRIYDLTTAAK